MKATLALAALSVSCIATATFQAQQPAAVAYTQTLTYIKANQGKGDEYVGLLKETIMKTAQNRANAGEILSWTLLRSVFPAGEEARADYVISTISEGPPPPPRPRALLEADLKKAGIAMTASEYIEKRNSLSKLVAVEMWRPMARVGAPKVGHYLFLNHMKVLDAAKYTEFEQNVWRPMAEEWVKQGALSGWIFATKLLPAGTETAYAAYSADMFPTWEAVFASRPSAAIFEKTHAGKNYDETMGKLGSLRQLARRELWQVIERVEKDGAARASRSATQ